MRLRRSSIGPFNENISDKIEKHMFHTSIYSFMCILGHQSVLINNNEMKNEYVVVGKLIFKKNKVIFTSTQNRMTYIVI